MNRYISAILATVASLLLSLDLRAQGSIDVQVPNLVAVDEQFNITFVIDGEKDVEDFQWEPTDDFQLVWGPQRGRSSSFSSINGKTSRSTQTTFTYVLLPKKTGNLQIPSASARLKGGANLRSTAKTVEVVSNGASSSSRQSNSSQGSASESSGASTGTLSDEDIFLRFTLSKSKAVVGETITATLMLYQRVNIAGFEDARFPTFNGFWSQELQAPSNIEFHRESIGDKIYNAATLRSWNLIAQQAGDIQIEPAELVCLVNVRNRAASTGSIFDSFFQDDYRTIRKRVTSKAYTVHVSALPAGAPASYGGGVGSFHMSASISADSLKTHDAASVKVTVSGKGNVNLLEAPKVNFPPDFEVYDTKTTDGSGSRTFEYPFIPRSHGEFEIPAIEYTYYDIQAGKYVTLRSEPMKVKVARGNESEASASGVPVVSSVNRKDVRDLGSDIRFIATRKPSFTEAGSFFVWSPLFFVLILLAFAIAGGVWFAFRKLAAQRADIAGSKNRAATKMARKRLAQAGEYLKKNLYTAFYEELHRALLGFVSDKLNMDASDQSKENISAQLIAGGCPEPMAAEFISLLDACEFARYSPNAGHEAMNAHFETAVNVISSLDSSMKKKGKSAAGTAATAIAAFLMLIPLNGKAAQDYPDSLWNTAVSAYADGRYDVAIDSWKAISDLGVESADLYYNLGNAYFKTEDYAHAILFYERVLKIDPSHSDARFNLEFANGFIQDRIEPVPEFFLSTWMRRLCYLLDSDSWACAFLVLLVLTLALVLLFLLGQTSAARKTGFFAAIATVILALGALGMASWQKADYHRRDAAIVVRAVSSVKSAPGKGTDLFVLHEGTRVKVLDTVGDWNNIELADGRQGWLQAQDIEKI